MKRKQKYTQTCCLFPNLLSPSSQCPKVQFRVFRVFLCTDSPLFAPLAETLSGSADWAAGFSDEEPVEEIQKEIQDELTSSGVYEGWSFVQKGLLFGVILGAVALYIRLSKKKNPENVGYEKTMV